MIPPKDICPVPGDTSLKYGRRGTETEKDTDKYGGPILPVDCPVFYVYTRLKRW